jgi:hypothetical protein
MESLLRLIAPAEFRAWNWVGRLVYLVVLVGGLAAVWAIAGLLAYGSVLGPWSRG